MPKSLVIVESPTKARTISRFLGEDFIVDSSYGHVRDLPKSKLGVDVEHNFEPQYLIPRKASPVIKKLKIEVKKVEKIILATDEDREGEAIAWHLKEALKLKKTQIKRIVFHEITKKAIEEALKHPRDIDVNLVDAQQARRVLDRLVGYKLSPFLWKKIYRGLSAGRVQSVAVRLIVEREREIKNFKPEEYWSIEATLSHLAPPADSKEEFKTILVKINDKVLNKFAIKTSADTKKIIADIEKSEWVVEHVEKRAISKNPLPPLTTSTLQQEAFRKLGFSAKQTMMLAQQLYEGVELGEGSFGLITYMRTDSLNMSEEAIQEGRSFLKKEFGDSYLTPAPRHFKTKSRGAQEAHEAIRPTDPARTPESLASFLDKRQHRLYELIWRRFLATQMPAAIFNATTIDVKAQKQNIQENNYTFRTTGQTMVFDGFLKVYPIKFVENSVPDLKPQEKVNLEKLLPIQHFTEPQARFTEASLIKILEQHGIGRPSTYAPVISTIQERGYVKKDDKRRLEPTETGFLVNDLLVEHFPEIVDIEFTAKMENELDEVAEGKLEWQPLIREFYEPFAKRLEEKYEAVKKHEVTETTDEICQLCGKPMVVKLGRFGKFLACSGFPECKNTKTIKQELELIGMKCPKCKTGEIIIKRTRRRKIFYGCSRYPECDFASWTDPRKSPEKPEQNNTD